MPRTLPASPARGTQGEVYFGFRRASDGSIRVLCRKLRGLVVDGHSAAPTSHRSRAKNTVGQWQRSAAVNPGGGVGIGGDGGTDNSPQAVLRTNPEQANEREQSVLM